jgi:RNA polymerase sigma-70 factor (ECF subfamily)
MVAATMQLEGERSALPEPDRVASFEEIVLPHLDSAFRLARCLTRDEHDAQDVLQDAYLRAFKYFDAFAGGSARAWLLSIVRNSYYTLNDKRPPSSESSADELDILVADGSPNVIAGRREPEPDAAVLRAAERDLVDRAIASLPDEFREVLVLRELEECSYKEIAKVTGIPIGTVMSRLSRARSYLRTALGERIAEEHDP